MTEGFGETGTKDAVASACAGGSGGAGLPPVTILLSTFNGERYLASQLDSFRAQIGVSWRLCWRDDGSDDGTLRIMREFAREIGEDRCAESISSGPHLGAAESFLRLLTENREAEFIAFADQDDRWHADKLQRGTSYLTRAGETAAPALYCTRQILTDDDFSHPRPSIRFDGVPGFPAALTQNIATGNTIVMNAAAARLISEVPLPEASSHDWWSYILVTACGGRAIYDPQPSMLYRQHTDNMVGSPRRTLNRAIAALERGPVIYMTMLRRHVERLHEYRHLLHPQAVAYLELIRGGLTGGYQARIAALRCRDFRRATRLETLLFRLWFVLY